MALFGPDDEVTPEDLELAARRIPGAFHTLAARYLKAGDHPDAIRARFHHLEEARGEPLGDDVWRAIEDALAGRPAAG